MKTIASITNANQHSGVGGRAFEIAQRLKNNPDIAVSLITLDGIKNNIGDKEISRWPSLLGSKSVSWIRLARHIEKYDVYDITNQSLSFIAKHKKPSIVTVHDIIELTNPQDSRAYLLNKYLLSGIARATKIVSVSEYTKQSLVEHLHIPEQDITVIPNGASAAFYPIENFSSTIAYKQLDQEFNFGSRPIVLCVGSEHPRKNMKTVLETIAALTKTYPDILLIKVGDAGIADGRRATLTLIDSLGIQKNVLLLGTVSEERLNELYNSSNVVLCPSFQEGFGLAVLQGMKSGCPVVCSNTTSLPEVTGDAALLHEPNDVEAYAESIKNIITNAELQKSLVQKGLQRAKQFSWDTAANAMLEIYKELL